MKRWKKVRRVNIEVPIPVVREAYEMLCGEGGEPNISIERAPTVNPHRVLEVTAPDGRIVLSIYRKTSEELVH